MSVDGLEPLEWCLSQTVEALVQLAHPVGVLVVDEAFWLGHQSVVLKLCVEEGRVDVDWLDLEVIGDG